MFDKKDSLLKCAKVIPCIGDLEGVPVNINLSNLSTFIDRIVLVSYSLEHWGFVTDKPSSIYRTILEFDRLMKHVDPVFV